MSDRCDGLGERWEEKSEDPRDLWLGYHMVKQHQSSEGVPIGFGRFTPRSILSLLSLFYGVIVSGRELWLR